MYIMKLISIDIRGIRLLIQIDLIHIYLPTNSLYEFERFLEKEPGKDRYLVKCKGYGHEHNTWCPLHALDGAQEFIDEYRSRRPTRRRAAALGLPTYAPDPGAPLPLLPPTAAPSATETTSTPTATNNTVRRSDRKPRVGTPYC
ncbi:hypothetical protein N7G274_008367 [Stereocaulon virgatum]|uniref:Chromo domain-containing protein n=1 Tax=Stereocaulon virgatum TaxID=373712 RepID=A0ABR4A054_9LECA